VQAQDKLVVGPSDIASQVLDAQQDLGTLATITLLELESMFHLLC